MKPFNLESLREGNADCPSDLKLELFVSGELDAAQRTQFETHCAGCTSCQARVAERRQGWDAQPVDSRVMLAAIRRAADAPAPTAWWKKWLPIVALAGAAAAVAVLVARPDAGADTTRIKGSAILKVFRFEDGHAKEVASGSKFSAGDRLRFVVDLPAAGAIAVLGVDSKRSLYVAWPPDGESPVRPAGQGIELPGAVALDDTPGSETLFLVHCPGRDSRPDCSVSADGSLACGSGCSVSSFEVKK